MLRALIVIYNKKIDDSITYNAIKDDSKIKLIIYDNSNETYIDYNKKFCKKNTIEYYTQNKNVGLSKAYNYVIRKLDVKGYLIILDDDTKLTKEYLAEVHELTKKEEYEIILPIVKSNNKIISPASINNSGRVKVLKNIEDIDYSKITAINSGMIIKNNVYNEIKYNEELFLDYVDHDFMDNIRKSSFNIKIMDSIINQNFSFDQKNNIDSELHRFTIYKNDFKNYCFKNNKKIYYRVSIMIKTIKKIIKYKSLKFLMR